MAVGVGIGGIPSKKRKPPVGSWVDTDPWYNNPPAPIPGYDDIAAKYGTNPGYDYNNTGLNLPPWNGTPAGSSGGSKGPLDYNSILAADPYYNQLEKDLMAQSVADAASLKAARQRALIQFGEVPNFSGLDLGVVGGDFNSALTPDIQELIRQNTASGLSTTARMRDADVTARRGIRNALNARGSYNSGETGYQLGNEAKDYLRAQNDSRLQLIDALGGYNSQFIAAERARQAQLSQAALDAFLRGQYDDGSGGGGGGGGNDNPPPDQPFPIDNGPKDMPDWWYAQQKKKPVFGGFNARPM